MGVGVRMGRIGVGFVADRGVFCGLSRVSAGYASTILHCMMKKKLSDLERKVLSVVQRGFPVSETPYVDMAREAGVETGELLGVLRGWAAEKKLRRIGAIVNHFKVGMGAGAMVAWNVEDERVEDVGTVLAAFAEVSHAYERHTEQHWPYNVYTMVHGESDEQVREVVRRMSEAAGVGEYRVLVTERELKKVAPTYVFEDDE